MEGPTAAGAISPSDDLFNVLPASQEAPAAAVSGKDPPQQLGRQRSARRPGPPSTAAPAANALDEADPGDGAAPAQQQEQHDQPDPLAHAQLPDIWRHLRQLEKAVRSHIQSAPDAAGPQYAPAKTRTPSAGGIGRGGSSILSAAAAGHRAEPYDASGSADSTSISSSGDDEEAPCKHGPSTAAASARASERAKLRDSLSKIKSEIADKAVKEVEASLLQQRVACLEAALAGLTGGGLLAAAATAPGCASCAGSFAGSMLSLGAGRASVCLRCQSQAQQQQQQQLPQGQQQTFPPRASTPTLLEPGVSQLYDRLGDMEAAMRELAHAQATSSSVLSELGGRLSSTAGATGWPSATGTVLGSTSPGRGSLLRRPPSCPLNEGPLNSWAFNSPPPQRPSNPLAFSPLPQRPSSACAAQAGSPGGFSSVLANPVFSFDSPSRSSASPMTPPVTSSGAVGEQQAASAKQEQGRSSGRTAQQEQQQAHHWHVDVVLASHDAELAGVKEAVAGLEASHQAAVVFAEETVMHVASLDDRLRALEHAQLATPSAAGLAPTGMSDAHAGDSSSQQQDPDLEATLSRGIGAAAEDAAGSKHGPGSMCATELQADSYVQTTENVQWMPSDSHSAAQSPASPDGDTERPACSAVSAVASLDKAALIQQLLSSKLLDDLITSRVQQAVAAQAGRAAACGRRSPPEAAGQLEAPAATDSSASTASHSLPAASEAVHMANTLPAAVPVQDTFKASIKSDSAILQQLHSRLAAVEGTVAALVAQQHTQQEQAGQAAPPPRTAGQPAAAAALQPGAAAGLDSAVSACAEGEPTDASATPGQLAAEPSGKHDADPLTDGFCSFQSAVSATSAHSAAALEDGGAAGSAAKARPQQQLSLEDQPCETSSAAAVPAPATEGAALEASLAGGSCPANVAIEQLVEQLAAPVTLLRDSEASGGSQAAPSAVKSALWSCRTSTTQVEKQLTALQHEVDACELQAMQSALEVLDCKLQQLHQQQLEQALLAESHKVSTGASLALLAPLEPRVEQLSGQLGSLAEQVSALHALVSQQPARFEVLQGEIEQLSQQLAEVNEAAAEEPDVQLLREQLGALQQHHTQLRAELVADIRAATDAAAAAAAVASTAAETAAGVESSTRQQLAAQQEQQEQRQQQASEAILLRLAAVEGSVQQLGQLQKGMSHLQQQLAQHMDSAREQAAVAAAAAAEQHDIIQTLAASAAELASKLQATEVSVHDRVGKVEADAAASAQQTQAAVAAAEAQLQQQGEELRTLAAAQDAQHNQLKQQQEELRNTLAASSDELTVKLSAVETAIADAGSKVVLCEASLAASGQQLADGLAVTAAGVDAKLEQAAFTAAQEAHDAELKQQLKEQVDTMAQILAELGSYKAQQGQATRDLQEQLDGLKEGQETTHAAHSTRLEELTGQLQLTAQQLKEELSSTINPLQTRLQAAAATLAEHDAALQGARSVAAAVELLSGLPAAAAELSAQLEELLQAQRAAEGELSANKEHCMVLDQQVGAAQAQLRVLEATLVTQQEQGGRTLEQMRREMLEPIVQELERLEQHKQRLQQLQQEQAAAVERLGGALEAVKGDVLGELARERLQLAQAVEELQATVREECVKTDQLGTIFAARDNMYGAWLKMQAVFDANKSPRRGNTAAGGRATVHDRSPSSSLFRPRYSLAMDAIPSSSAAAPASAGLVASSTSGALPGPAAAPEAAFDPFSEVLNRLEPSPEPQQQQDSSAAEQVAGSEQSVQPLTAAVAALEAPAMPAAGNDQLTEVAEAQAQLREEVGSLAIQLHAAMADLTEQVAALRQLQPECSPALQQQQVPCSAAHPSGEPLLGAADAAAAVVSGQDVGSMPRGQSASSGVLHAPLSLVLQLQQELSGIKAERISKEQFSAVVRMVKELRSQSCGSEAPSPVASPAQARSISSLAAAGFGAAAATEPSKDLAALHSSEPRQDTPAGAANAAAVDPADAASAAGGHKDAVSEVLQQYSQQLAALESSLQALLDKTTDAEAQASSTQQQQAMQQLQSAVASLQQQQPSLLQQQEDLQQQQSELSAAVLQQATLLSTQTGGLSSSISQIQTDLQQQQAALAAGLSSAAATQQQVEEVSSQQASLRSELSKVSTYVDELASKLHSAANAAAMAMARPHGSGTLGDAASGGSGFAEMVAGLANLKSCLDQQAKVVAELSTRLEDQDGVLQGLLESSSAQPEGAAEPGASADAAPAAAAPGGSNDPEGAFVSRAELQALAQELAAVQQKLARLEQAAPATPLQHGDTPTAEPAAPAASATDPAAAQPAAADWEAGSKQADAESGGGGQPLGFMHGMLVELKQRIKKLEADSLQAKAAAAGAAAPTDFAAPAVEANPQQARAAAAAASASVSGTPTRKTAGGAAARRGAAWAGHGGTDAAAGLQELQEWLDSLQGEVSQLAAHNATLGASVESLRGDVGAAAAAAAAAAIAATAVSNAAAGAAPMGEGGASSSAVQQVAQAGGLLAGLQADVSSLWAAVEGLKAELLQRDEAELTAQAAAWAAGAAGLANSTQGQQGPAAAEGAVDVRGSGNKVLQLQAEVEGFRGQLLCMQQQVQALAAAHSAEDPATSAVAGAFTTPVKATASSAAAAAAPEQSPCMFFTPSAEEVFAGVQQGGSSSPACMQKCLSFGDLAGSNNGASATVAPASDPLQAAPTAGAAEPGVEPDFAAAATDVPSPTTQAAAAASHGSNDAQPPARQASDPSAGLSRSSSSSSRASSRSNSSSLRGHSSRSGKTSVRLLLEDMAGLPAAKQVAVVSKLAGLVSSHAIRLLATYHDDPSLSAQLHAVQQQLASAVHCAAASPAAGAAAGQSSSIASPALRAAVSRSVSTARPAAAASSNSGEALLCILDQMASLRAIGSATHPAIAEKLHKHEEQLAELREAQQGITAAIAALTGGAGAIDSAAGLQALPLPVLAAQQPSELHLAASAAVLGAQEPQQESQATALAAATSCSLETGSTAAAAASMAAAAGMGEVGHQEQQAAAAGPLAEPGQAYEGELAHRLLDVESWLAAGLKVLSAVRNKLPPLQEVADATQSMMRELQVAQGLALHRLEALEGLANSGAAVTASAAMDEQQQPAGGVLAAAGSLKRLQEDIQAAGRRLSALEASVASQVPECVTLARRLAARQADAETRSSTVTAKVATLVSSLPPLAERVGELEARLTRSLAVAKQGLDILADQLVALGALNGRASPNKNPLAALGPNSAAITALEGKVEAVRTAMTASVKLMIQELAAAAEQAGDAGSSRTGAGAAIRSGVTDVQVAAQEAAKAATAAHEEAILLLEQKLAGLQAELRAVTGS